jgi:uncharacterized protein (TIGR02996 family)
MTADPLLAAVFADPDDDLPRLVYADWLEDHGDAARAEFVRVQIALAGGGRPPTVPTGVGEREPDRGADAPRSPERLALQVRERRLLAEHGAAWLAPLRARGGPLFNKGTHGVFRRGFLDVVWMPAAVFAAKAEKLFALAPVRELRVTRATAGELAALLGHPAVGRLAALDLSDRGYGSSVGRLLAGSPAAARLRTLRLRNCDLRDEDALRLADAADGWPLEALDVSLNPLSASAVAALRARFGDEVVRFDR